MEYAVQTFSLTKIFSDWWGRAKVYAVENLNLEVRRNEVFGLLGPNGSGKTTTLKMLLGLLHPTSGKALCLGGDARDPKISARIGFQPEESYLYRYLSARETLDFYGRLFGLDRRVRRMRTEALLEMVGLKAVASRPVGTFSKGMARRIALAQALINDPDLLILDEPTTGLDPIGTRQIKDLIIRLAERGKSVLLCSHLLADVEDVCDRIAILYGGRIQAAGEVAELLKQSDKRQIVTDAISDQAIERIKQIVTAENARCEVRSPMHKLETFFIETVTAAQEQAQRTSGAVSTTQIGDFLAGRSGDRDLLEKLVSAPVTAEPAGESPQDRQGPAAGPESSGPDEGLLETLVEPVEPAEERPQRPAEPAETRQVEPAESAGEQVDKDLLDELTGRKPPATQQPQDPGQQQGEAGDA